MDPALPRFLARMILSTTPQQAFEQVDELILQASALREQAQELQEQINFLNDRADCLTATAEGLQQIAEQDRDAIQTMFERSLCAYKHMYAVYVSAPRKEARFNDIRTRSEDGMVTMEEMEAFLEDVYQYFLVTSERVQRSAAPEPESPPSVLDTAEAQNQSVMELTTKQDLKRKFAAFQEEDESGVETDSQRSKVVNDGVVSDDEASSDEDEEDGSATNAETQDENSGGSTTQTEESSDGDTESASDDPDADNVDTEAASSSDNDTGSVLSTGSHTAVNIIEPNTKNHSDRSSSHSVQPLSSSTSSSHTLAHSASGNPSTNFSFRERGYQKNMTTDVGNGKGKKDVLSGWGTSKGAKQRRQKRLKEGFIWNESQYRWQRPSHNA
ncbi:uncharacterized protein Z520_10141 [Fonsecaea multimorphosa CBS 102226]|uniref:Uncharacterized protein n=1 Tax=Fonsecaea multimorphosa CBS 102226 TaxID=1442371 RepID=A0A0D2GWY3_9EURO|nr:uncharacterized protein Z520_10141 [Fonsecaea multimorphosa CBS 102226]KIX94115.1 hypothetical protein Z520_10141 [Fonsecaea multimorphosa CBS 102226]OAL19468.1 hypothetical protein AYO22_09630 [Fonsecaea multimorphosa]